MSKRVLAATWLLWAGAMGIVHAQERIEFQAVDYELQRFERTRTYPPDLLASDRSRVAPAPPAKGQEFMIVRFTTAVTRSSNKNPQTTDVRLVGNGAVYRCQEVNTWCRAEGCGAAFVFYVPKDARLERFELGGTSIALAE